MSYTKTTSLSKKKIAIKIKKIDKLFHKWWDENSYRHLGGVISWGLQKKFLSEHLVKENLLRKYQLKDFWKAFDATCNIAIGDWDEVQLPLLKTMVYLANETPI